METKEQYLLEAKNLSKYFPVKNFFGKLVQEVRAVDRVNLSIKKEKPSVWWESPAVESPHWAVL